MEKKRPQKRSFTVHIREDLIERTRTAVYWTPGLTLSGLTEEILEKAVSALEKKNGGSFPPREGDLKPGRPVGSLAREKEREGGGD